MADGQWLAPTSSPSFPTLATSVFYAKFARLLQEHRQNRPLGHRQVLVICL